MANVTTSEPPAFDSNVAMKQYLNGEMQPLSESFLTVLEHFQSTTYYSFSMALQNYLNRFVNTFLYIFAQPDFRVPDPFITRFIHQSRTISNMVAISCHKTTDAFLDTLRTQEGNFVKILTLYSARNKQKFDLKPMFDLQTDLASRWYWEYACLFYSGLVNETVRNNLTDHFLSGPPRLTVLHQVQEAYFGATYVDGKCDRAIKECINKAVKEFVGPFPVWNRPNPKKIAVLSACWSRSHSVYRSCSAYVRALKEKYHLTFFQFGTHGGQETSLFDEVYPVNMVNGFPDLSRLRENDFQVMFYPDIGMCSESIVLANLRLAPIQICSLGHSCSTYGAEVDYYFSGADVETKDAPEQHYSERLVLIPGMGVVHNRPLYEPKGLRNNTNNLVINCPWYSQKLTYPFVQTLKKIIDRSRRTVKIRLMVGPSTCRANDHLPFCQDLVSQLGSEHLEIYANLNYHDYMTMLEQGDMLIDSFHFGGCNTISDSLFLRIPAVTWEGQKWYNRIGSQMLRLAGVPECIATNEEEYLDIITRMSYDHYRAEIKQKLMKADLNSTIYGVHNAQYFRTAVDYLVDNHERLKQEGSRKPLYVGRDI